MLAVILVLIAGMASPLPAQMTDSQLAAHAEKAQAAERAGDFSTAVREYRALAAALPKNAEIESNLGVALYLDHQLSQAAASFRKAIALNPDLFAPHLFSGMAWYQLSRPDLAVPELERAVQLNPSDVNARIWLGYSYTAQSQNSKALKEFEAATRLDPDNVNAWYQLGEAWLQAGKDATTELLTVAPDGARAWQLAGEQAQMVGSHQKALTDFKHAEALRPDIPELRSLIKAAGGTAADIPAPPRPQADYSEEDHLYHEAHDAENQSRSAFQQVFRLAPDSYRAHQISANALVMEGKDSDAIAEYRKVLEQKPDLAGVHQAIGEALIRSGKLPEALDEFKAEMRMQPHSAVVHMDAGRTLLLMGKDAAAEKMLSETLEMNQPPAETYLLLGRIHVRRGDNRGALPLLQHYISEVKGNSDAYYLLAMIYRNLGIHDQMQIYLALYRKTSHDAQERR